MRICINYQTLNNVTIKNWYSLPWVDKLLERVEDAKFFSKMDLASEYYQIRIASGNKEKTVFWI